MHDQLFSNAPTTQAPAWKDYAEKAGVDVQLWDAHRRHPALIEAVQKERETALALGAKGTPAFFINGRLLLGFQTAKTFDKEVASELEKAKALLEKGVARADVAATLEKSNNAAFAQALRRPAVQKDAPAQAPKPSVKTP